MNTVLQEQQTGWHCTECDIYFGTPAIKIEQTSVDPPLSEQFDVCPHCGKMDIERANSELPSAKENAIALAAARKELSDAKTDIERLLIKVREDNTRLFDRESNAKTAVEAAERQLRESALAEYDVTKDKAVCPGVSIIISKTPQYDPECAFAWAKENARVCINPETLNVKAFNDLCKGDTTKPAFVEIKETPSVRIAVDLDKKLGEVA